MFKDIRLPDRICKAFTGGPTFATSLTAARSGFASANADRLDPQFKYTAAATAFRDQNRLDLMAFFMVTKGMAYTFRFRDFAHYWHGMKWIISGGLEVLDYEPVPANIAPFATGDGTTTTFQLFVPYAFGGETVLRKITKPAKIEGSYLGPKIYLDAVLKTVTTHYAINYSTGVITFTSPPANGALIRYSGMFDVHVRFSSDALELALDKVSAEMTLEMTEELAA